MKFKTKLYFDMIDREKNIYQQSKLYRQIRRKVDTYLHLLMDPVNKQELKLCDDFLISKNKYKVTNDVPNFTKIDITSNEWEKLNTQFLNYHKSLSVYTLINSAPIINYLSIDSEIGILKNVKVLDIGGGTGHTLASFFHFPETIEYFLLDPNLRLLHDQFIRIYPKLSYLEMAHILANAENLPIVDNAFDVVLNISAIDHMDDYKKFISEAYRVLKKGGKFLISSHLDIPPHQEDKTKFMKKIFSNTFLERYIRYKYFKRYSVGKDDHTLHLKNEKPIEDALVNAGFKITKQKVFKRYFYFLAEK